LIGELFKALLITSLAGSALAVVISLLRPVTKKLFGYSWHYYIWLCVLFVMLMPVRFSVNTMPTPNIATQTVQTQQETVSEQPETTENIVQTAPAQKPQLLQKATVIWDRIIYNRMNILAYLWLIGAMALMLLNVVRYVRLNIKIRKTGEVISCPETRAYTDRKINVRVWENVASPFITGIFRPMLILPKTELSEEQLHNILRHEMTHFKRHDILYKWFAEFVKCVHWFNPTSWYVSKQIAAECEISCDMSVTKNMSGSEEMSYVSTILSLIPTGKSKQLPLTTQMASSKKILKRRFIMIKNKKTTSRFMSVISAVIAVAMLSTTVFASGILSDLTTDDYTIEILSNGEKIELTNKPFIENDEVYLPLRETLTNIGTLNHTGSYITWDNGKIEVHLADVITETMDIADIEFSFEIGKPDFIIDPNGTPNIFFRSIKTSPILKDNLTYVPYSLMEPMMEVDTNNRVNNIGYTIFDKSGNIIKMVSNSVTIIKTSQYDNTTPEYTVDQFFYLFSNGDFGNMKRYCTQNCIDNFFRDNSVFGMKKATLQSISKDADDLRKRGFFIVGEWAALVNVTMTPAENSVFDPNQTETSFYLILKQQNGRYLIDEFATGL
jgi:beta-lactamase regulating signal transducer with metallopeptidase domain